MVHPTGQKKNKDKNKKTQLTKSLIADQLIAYPTCMKTPMILTRNLKFSPK